MEIRLPPLADLNLKINQTIKKEVKKNLELILYRISKDEGLSLEGLIAKYMHIEDNGAPVLTKTSKKPILDEEQCAAKVSNGDRCSRRTKGDNKYCGGHLNSRPYGEIKSTGDLSSSLKK